MDSIKTKHGTFAVHEKMDAWFVHSLKKHSTQIEDIDVALDWVSADSIVVDVGAHIGLFTVPLAKKVKLVYSVEPNKDSRNLLEKNIKDNNVQQKVIVLPNVLTDGEKKFSPVIGLPYAETQYRESTDGLLAGVPLDSLLEMAHFIKIDVEGMELDVLRGASSLIKKSKPIILFEINKKALDDTKNNRKDIGKFLKSRNYNLYRIENGRLNKLFSLNQSVFMNVMAIPSGVEVKATGPIAYLIKQIWRKTISAISSLLG